jgi:DNA-binding NtrC family response regulator
VRKESLDLIHTWVVEDLIHAIEGEQPVLNIERVIDMQQAVQALRRGMPMAAIVRDASETLEQHLIQCVLNLTQGNKSEAARRLRIDYKTLYRKLQKYTVSERPERYRVSDVGEL